MCVITLPFPAVLLSVTDPSKGHSWMLPCRNFISLKGPVGQT